MCYFTGQIYGGCNLLHIFGVRTKDVPCDIFLVLVGTFRLRMKSMIPAIKVISDITIRV